MKREFKWACMFLFFAVINILVEWLFTGETEAPLYGLRICVFLYIVFLAARVFAERRKCRTMQEIRFSGGDSALEKMAPSESFLEKEYQETIYILKEEKDRLYCEKRKQEQQNREYYTMWIHQIKTPIAAMRLLIQSQERGERRGRMEQELLAMEQYAQMALHYIHLQEEDNDLVLKEYELSDIVKRAVRKYSVVFIEKKLRMDFEEFSCPVVTDNKWLGIMMEQIISNSAKYTNQGGVHIFLRKRNELVITDTGIGIREEDLPRIFERGFTGYNGRQDRCSTGIGLYLCSQIAKKLGVQLTVDSKVNQGTSLYIGFPTDVAASGPLS